MIGFCAGRPLAAKILATAPASSALAPRPYTVSVGNATRPPALRSCAARAIASGSENCPSTRKTSDGMKGTRHSRLLGRIAFIDANLVQRLEHVMEGLRPIGGLLRQAAQDKIVALRRHVRAVRDQ